MTFKERPDSDWKDKKHISAERDSGICPPERNSRTVVSVTALCPPVPKSYWCRKRMLLRKETFPWSVKKCFAFYWKKIASSTFGQHCVQSKTMPIACHFSWRFFGLCEVSLKWTCIKLKAAAPKGKELYTETPLSMMSTGNGFISTYVSFCASRRLDT